ncbi:MAG: hypothetical protein FJX23_10050, partial [Alphaproteobacteria bacterium]|nr:hypothetical protein [Alphaproteobacteria bacterium]
MNRRILAPLIACICLSISVPAQATQKPDKLEKYLQEAQTAYGSYAQFELSRAYYFGIDGAKKDEGEAYYWASICAKGLKNTASFEEQITDMERMAFIEETNRPGVDPLGAYTMKLLLDPEMRIVCEDMVTVLGEKLPAAKKREMDAKAASWVAEQAHAEAPFDEAQFQRFLIKQRLASEATAPKADPEGISKLLAQGGDAYLKQPKATQWLKKATENGATEAMETLIDGGMNQPEYLRDALEVALDNNDAKAEKLLRDKGAPWNEELASRGLIGAMKANDAARADAYVKNGATLGNDPYKSKSLLSALIQENNVPMIKRYIALGGTVPSSGANSSGEPLQAAAQYADGKTLDVLFNTGIAKEEKFESASFLDSAVRSRNLAAVQKVLPLATLQEAEKTKLMANAVNNYHKPIVDYLLGKGFTLTEEQKTTIATCAPEELVCEGGRKIYGGPPHCQPIRCIEKPKAPLQEPVAHPSNTANAKALEVFSNGSSKEKTALIDTIQKTPGLYSPRVLNAMSHALFHKLRDDEGIFWGLAAEMRHEADSKICPLNEGQVSYTGALYSTTHDFYKRREPEKVKEALERVRAWDAETPYDYNPQSSLYLSTCVAPERWEGIRAAVRRTFVYSSQTPLPEPKTEMLKMDELLPRAEKGDVEAQHQLGYCYLIPMQCR